MVLDPIQLRRQLRALRRELSVVKQRQAARTVADQITHWPVFVAARRIAGYWACDGELDPLSVLEQAWNSGKMVYLPVLAESPPQFLRFALYQPGTPLRRNRFHIPEPDVAPADWLKPTELDLVLMPLVAFDPTGTRLGMGGFYDRSFAFLLDRLLRLSTLAARVGLRLPEGRRVAPPAVGCAAGCRDNRTGVLCF